MYSVSEKFKEQIVSDNREFSVTLTFNSSTELTGTTIQSISVDEVVNSTDTLTLGCACSNKITVDLINAPTDIDYENSFFTATVGLKVGEMPTTYEYVPLGKFYIADAETSNGFKNLKLTAYDGFCKMTGVYNATVSADTTLQAVYDDLKAQLYDECGIILKAKTLPENPLTFPYIENLTYQQAIGYVAGCLGGFARFDRNGELEITTYTDSEVEIDRNLQYMNGFKRLTKKELNVTTISTGTKDNPIVRGEGANGTEINYENPYITAAMADDVYASFLDLTYTPCQVKWRGNPAVQAGDIVSVPDKDEIYHTVLVMSQNIRIGGGLNSTIDCKGKSDTTSKFSNSFETTTQKIERVHKALEQAILDATNSITGNSGGYVAMLDTNGDGKPDEFVVTDSENIKAATQVWRWNKAGLGYAENPNGNAYAGPYRTAITADGRINADFITTGTLSAERIAVETYDDKTGLLSDYIHFDNGTMVFGKKDSEVTLKLEHNQVAFYSGDVRLAYFSNNSFEIENLDFGKVRFGDFGYILRKSGNLTFTKLT
jgi:hypothetical protein